MTDDSEATQERRLEQRIESLVRHAVANAVQPYVLKLRDLEYENERLRKLMDEDRNAQAARVKEASEKYSKETSEEVAKQVVREFIRAIGQDPDDLNKFRKLIDRLAELVDALGSGKKTVYFLILTTLAGGVLTALWVGFKSAVMKP